VIDQLTTLKSDGYKIALDDFGSEKSNFSRLQALEVEYIKIDGGIIRNIDTNPASVKITETIVSFARMMGAKTIAEFVASEEIYRRVVALGIDYSQGFFFGKPQAGYPVESGNLVFDV